MNCGACCGNFSLDYLPTETPSALATFRTVVINDHEIALLSDLQSDVKERWCRHLQRTTGRCSIHAQRPFACDFELLRLLHYADKVVLTQKLYGRAWAMKRLDGERGARCDMLPPDAGTIREVRRKLERLYAWARHLQIVTCLPEIMSWIDAGVLDDPLVIQTS